MKGIAYAIIAAQGTLKEWYNFLSGHNKYFLPVFYGLLCSFANDF